MCADRSRRLGIAAVLWVAALLPAAGAVQAAPSIQSWETPNGARVLFVEAPELPILDVRVVFDAAGARDGDSPGLASLTNSLLSEGAGPWSADQIAERLEAVGAELSSGSLRDMAWVSARTLTEDEPLRTTIETLAAVIAEPRFDPEDLERVRANTLVALKQEEQSPAETAKKAFYRAVYGDHPYGAHPSGTPESVAAIDRSDVVAFHRRYYVARNAVVAIVGAVSREQAGRLAERVTAGLAGGESALPLPQVPEPADGSLVRVDFPSSQSHIYSGQPGMRRGDPDYFPLYVGNHILGGNGLVSQLSEEVRNERGLSYSVYSYFLPMQRRGPFVMGAQTKNAQADEALAVMRRTVLEFIERGPTADELDEAKQNITGGFPLRIDSNDDIVEYLAMIGFYGLPLDYLDTLVDKVDAVTAAQIRDAFSRRLHPDRFVTIILGGGVKPVSESR
ncbi:MAG: pitrilysin family protein [Chromatiales bacterium]|jgi:zinc protease